MSDVPSRLLKETLRDRLAPPPSSGCLDADMLAAWCDETLNRRDRAIVESHAATCARCQAILAAMAKTAPPLATRKWWQTSTFRVLVPIATASVLAVVVWMNVPSRQRAASVAQYEGGASVAQAPVPQPRSTDVAAPAAKAADVLERSDAKQPEPPAARTSQPSARAESAAIAPPAAAETARSSGEQREQAIAPPPLLIAPEVPVVDAQRPRLAAAPPPPPATAPPPPPAAAPAPAQSTLRPAPAPALADTLVIEPPQAKARRSSALLSIQSPNQNVVWRVVAGTSVERSTDGGTTWQPQSIGAPAQLAAGAAPSPTVCWLVGSGGVVLLTNDGRTWQRVAFPAAVDLTAIFATDGSNATVTASDGRAFVTTDGGKTWRVR